MKIYLKGIKGLLKAIFGSDCMIMLPEVVWRMLVYVMLNAVQTLKEKEQRVIMLYWGISSQYPWTLEKIGNELNLTRERVRQIKEIALKKLRLQIKPYNTDLLQYSFITWDEFVSGQYKIEIADMQEHKTWLRQTLVKTGSKNSYDTPISELMLPFRIHKVIKNAGIKTLGEFFKICPEPKYLLGFQNIGHISLKAMIRVLKENGFKKWGKIPIC